MKIKLILVTLLFLAGANTSFSQKGSEQTKMYYGVLEVTYLTGMGNFKVEDTKLKNNSNTVGIRAIIGKSLSDGWGIGLGIGLDRYNDPDFNTLPLFLDLRKYHTMNTKKISTSFKIGLNPNLNGFHSNGWFVEPLIGMELLVMKRIDALLSISYKVQQFRNADILVPTFNAQNNVINWTTVNDNFFIKNLGINLGIRL